MYSIGEFSRITGLTVKTLRFYHEQGVLEPSRVDPHSGYRYYAAGKIETARIISQLRALEFTLTDIAELLELAEDESDILEHLQKQRQKVLEKMQDYRAISRSLDQIIAHEQEARATMRNPPFTVERKTLDSILVAGIRMQGRYSDCGPGFAEIGKRFGRQICGKPFMLHFDEEFKEEAADFEVGFPIRKGTSTDAITVRQLGGGECLSLVHQGPYDNLGQSYAQIFDAAKQQGSEFELPTREVYLKGPGMIFKGNPRKYLTEIQLIIKQTDSWRKP